MAANVLTFLFFAVIMSALDKSKEKSVVMGERKLEGQNEGGKRKERRNGNRLKMGRDRTKAQHPKKWTRGG